MHLCPLCHHQQTSDFFQDKRRRYYRCEQCWLIFVDPNDRLDSGTEKAHYDQHENDPQDQGYRRFLSRMSEPLLARLAQPNLEGLDFGCGPGPTLSLMIEEAGHQVALYDVYYAPDERVLSKQYDFVTCTEAIEHFYTPSKEWELLLSLVKPGGWLGIMTKLARDVDAFSTWHYKNDATHVSFFSRETFLYLAKEHELAIEFIGNDVILLRKTQ
ncbi:class I SAM-dependent methyltransferase [Vibrio sp. Of7-15]|uniref:class I SAM-dependent methyltransferase n=1 Tax=Vibrio sp. Of7-15 TaxID=2724879 RepID=UPI001EF1CE42|nr:class I SAM-dependent methyltransferase [Vibrio sp. Of7-15]MCG7496752.1 class I SAM-dependent methyltransferase [Vibrio sp. Of7-15]